MDYTGRQQEIIDTALDLIAQKGIQAVTIKNVSKKIGISEPAIYRHFDSKIHILISALDLFKEHSKRYFEHEHKLKASALEKIHHLFMNHFQSFSKKPSLVSIIFAEELFRNEKRLSSIISELIEYNFEVLRSIITEGQKNGEIRADVETQHLVIVVMGALRLFVKRWQFSNYNFDIIKKGSNFIEDLKRIMLPANK